MKTLIIASNNAHKIEEIKQILNDTHLNVISLKDAGVNIEVEEDGKTFEENAYKKAKEIKDYLVSRGKNNFMVMADDSGLTIDFLNGEPGVYSARYAVEHGNNKKNNELVLEKLNGVPKEKRTSSFVCSIVVLTSLDKRLDAEGRCDGIITEDLTGEDGFGYDPLFYVPSKGKTFAEMSGEEKNLISHRGRALQKVKENLQTII